MRGVGVGEWVVEELTVQIGLRAVSVHYRRPLSVMEVAQMGRTKEVISRPGRS